MTGHASPWRLCREASASARSAPVASSVLAFLAAAVCLAVFATAGRAAATEAQVVASIDDAGTRTITMTVTNSGPGLDPGVVDRIMRLDEVAWVLALGQVEDVTNAAVPGGTAVPSRAVFGSLPDAVALAAGRLPESGEAVVTPLSATELGLTLAAGGVVGRDGSSFAVVGSVLPQADLSDLERFVLRAPRPSDREVTSVTVVTKDAAAVPAVASALRALSGQTDARYLAVETSPTLLELSKVVGGQLGTLSRQLALGSVAIGTVLIALTMMGMVAARRKDMGRRRALGASRSALILLVAVQAVLPSALGAVVGTLLGMGITAQLNGGVPGLSFVVAVPALTLIAAVLGAIPAALASALSDPVRVLRVP